MYDTMDKQKSTLGNSPLEGWIAKSETGWTFLHRNLPKNNDLKQKARSLRKAGVLSEVIFWTTFKKAFIYNLDRQVIIGNYIVDFFIPDLGLIFEIDGDSHNYKGGYDMKREMFLQLLGLHVVHIDDLWVKKSLQSVADLVEVSIRKRVEEIELCGENLSTPSHK